MKKIVSLILLTAMLMTAILSASSVIAYTTPAEDAIPENIGIVRSFSGVDVSYTRRFDDENGLIPVGAGVGAHGAYETRIVRTENGTYAAFITDATGAPTAEHPGWDCGIATFSIVKITATGFERIFTSEYPQAQGSCTPNLVQGPNGIVYCVIIADDKDRRLTEYCNGVWLEVFKLDTATDTVTKPGGTQKYRHTTSPTDDHGYGYTQPIFDFEHGKMYALTCGGEAPGYLAWWIYDLNTDRWSSTCHTVQMFSRRCYINGYADGNGGFTIIIQRCAPAAALASALGVEFRTTGYIWDGLYLMHVANPRVNSYTDTEICVADAYTAEGYNNSGKNYPDLVSHYGNSGCTYLDDQGRIHVIYSHKIGNAKKTTVYHAVYDLVGNEIFKEALSTTLVPRNGKLTPDPKSYAMTQDTDGTYYVFCELTSSSAATLQLWKSDPDDGLHFSKLSTATTLQTPNGATVGAGKLIIGNSRCYSENDGYVPIMFEGSSGGECFYYTCIALPHAGEGAPSHTHTWDSGVVTTQPSCTAAGVKTYTCTGCGETYTESVPALGGHVWDEGIITLAPTYETEGVRTYTCTRCGETYTDSIPVLPPKYGDLNGDGVVNMRDLLAAKIFIASIYTVNDIVFVNGDIDEDGVITVRDISLLSRKLSSVD